MFSVSVLYGSMSWLLLFREETNAKAAVTKLNALSSTGGARIKTPGDCEIGDDFGQTIHAFTPPTAVMFEDMEKSKLMHIEFHLHRARTQQEVVKRAETDASLRLNRGGPAILQPMMGGGPNGFRGN